MSGRSSEFAPVSILGVGAVTPLGRDLNVIAASLPLPLGEGGREGMLDDVMLTTADAVQWITHPHPNPLPEGEGTRRVADELLNDPAIAKRMRRADRFARMTTLAALDAWKDALPRCQDIPMHRVGLIVSTGFGPHGRGFRFLDGILDCGDDAALPTDFSHSVHGAAAAYITEILDLRGPGLSNTDFENGFAECVQLAQCWLAQGTCDRVLVGAAEELGEVMLHCAGRMMTEKVSLGEGALFFVLGPPAVKGLGSIRSTGCQPVQKNLEMDQHGVAARATRNAVGLHASSHAFELLEMLLTQREGVIDNPIAFTPSSTARTNLILSRIPRTAEE